MRIIAGDVGGTKTLLQLLEYSSGAWEERFERRYESAMYPTFAALVQEFTSLSDAPISSACFAVAGPVVGRSASITNLPWIIEADELARAFAISRVLLVNDFYAFASALPLLKSTDLVTLHGATRDISFPMAVLGAGTGLGEASVVPTPSGWRVVPSEGGHADFAPADQTQSRLLAFLSRRYGHVSYERVLSGQGLVNIFTFLRNETPQQEEPLGDDEDMAAQIARLADQGDPLAAQAMGIFVDVYGAEAGNLALKLLARGGVYLGGGIVAKNQSRFTDGRFVRSFVAKGRMQSLMEQMPIYIITNQKAGLLGAAELAAREAASL